MKKRRITTKGKKFRYSTNHKTDRLVNLGQLKLKRFINHLLLFVEKVHSRHSSLSYSSLGGTMPWHLDMEKKVTERTVDKDAMQEGGKKMGHYRTTRKVNKMQRLKKKNLSGELLCHKNNDQRPLVMGSQKKTHQGYISQPFPSYAQTTPARRDGIQCCKLYIGDGNRGT